MHAENMQFIEVHIRKRNKDWLLVESTETNLKPFTVWIY